MIFWLVTCEIDLFYPFKILKSRYISLYSLHFCHFLKNSGFILFQTPPNTYCLESLLKCKILETFPPPSNTAKNANGFTVCFFICKIPLIVRLTRVPDYCQSAKDVFYTPELYRIEIQLQGLALTWPSWRLDWNIIWSTLLIGVSYGTILTLSTEAEKKEGRKKIEAWIQFAGANETKREGFAKRTKRLPRGQIGPRPSA